MTPSPIIRLKSVVQTLEHVIIPAVDPGNSLAIEQCALVLAQLHMLVRHMPFIGEYHALCHADLATTVAALPPAVGGPATEDAGLNLAVADREADGMTDASAAYHHLGRSLENLVRATAADGEAKYRAALDAAVLAFSRRQTRRARSWFRDAGFDHDPNGLPSLEDMVGGR